MHISIQNFGSGNYAKCFTASGIYEYAPRIHQFLEIQFILEGSLEITVDGVDESLAAGDVAVIAPYRTHSIRSSVGVKAWLLILSEDIVSDLFTAGNSFISNGSKCVFTPSHGLSEYIKENYLDLGERVIDLDFDQPMLMHLKSLAFAIIEEYARRVPQQATKAKRGALATVIIYLNEHFKEPLTRRSVAVAIGYNPSYISHTIEQLPGMSFRRLLNSIRVEHAKELLLKTDFSMLEIALESGFGGERTFFRAFLEATGHTPGEFKRKKLS